jgi:predicted dehydrogenase
MPRSVYSVGYQKNTSEIDHVVTHYRYEDVPMVVAEGGWTMADGYGFHMQYTVNFENATAVFDFPSATPLMLYEAGKLPAAVEMEEGMGYDHEIGYFLECIGSGRRPRIVTLEDGVSCLRIVEAESASAKTGEPVALGTN